MSIDLYEKKWQKFRSRLWLFKFIPFVDFVLAAGSLATGKVHENSDFDVIVGVRQRRIFIARAFCIAAFGLLGWRRRADRTNMTYSDKFCFNHFVTPAAYRLSPPYNDYWKKLYSSLAPVYGSGEAAEKFRKTNEDWAGTDDKYKINRSNTAGLPAKFFQILLSGSFGNWLERRLKTIQIKRIKKSLPRAEKYNPRIIYSDKELEFHPNTKRIEDFGRLR